MRKLIFGLCECKKQAVVLIEGLNGELEYHFAHSTLDMNNIGQNAVDRGLVETERDYDLGRDRYNSSCEDYSLMLGRLPQFEYRDHEAARKAIAGNEFPHTPLINRLKPEIVQKFFGRSVSTISCYTPDVPVQQLEVEVVC